MSIKSMKKVLAIAILVATGSTVHGQGIPVGDTMVEAMSTTTAIVNQIEQLGQWAEEFARLDNQIQQYRQQFEAITGSRGMAALLDNPAIRNALPPDWQNVISQIKSTSAYLTNRQKYPTNPSSPATNNMYDVLAAQQSVMQDMYNKTSQRIQQIQNLMAQIDSANDPAAKMDLTNRLISEQNAVQANQNLVSIMQTTQKQDLEAAAKAAADEYVCKEFKNPSC